MTDTITALRQRARETSTRILLPEGDDERVVDAARRIATEEIAQPVVVASDATDHELDAEAGIDVVSVPDGSRRDDYAAHYADLRGVERAVAATLLDDPLVFGALLVRLGEVDGMVAGAVNSTADVVATANGVVGLDPDVDTASSFFVMGFDDPSIGENGALLYADCGVNIEPSADRLADIAVTTAETARTLLEWSPKIAMLSFSTQGSASHPRAEKVAETTDQVRERLDDAAVAGEIQADVALDPDVANRKVDGACPIEGDANVFIFPNLETGNIAYKLTERLAGARALGPILQGYGRSVSDLSRGASVEDIVDITAVSAVRASHGRQTLGPITNGGLLSRRESNVEQNELSDPV
ncbi:phosphate acyltransferase [Natrialbaceae archaeon AArc-T1-2]|uniref:phosphate acyltransferase n=1 Tax=Natrialbaceae archaeon AArc-T1-2 TaxID=3053904 RepID=UPI00255AA88A|nr:phosphate acyltransferase [Natrialbaceae archaeon AArc-T1-2]WIV65921.1 phosphate acyltransferase [Natrialbaceae archaeon AArc-T1-2]